MAITGMSENIDDIKLELARRIYTAVVLNSSMLKIKDLLKYHEIEHYVNILKKRAHWNGVRIFLQHYPCFFLITDESNVGVVKPIVTVEFCRDFDGKKECGKSYCSKLHVCRHFVKGKCTFGPRCKKPHHFDNQETREVLKKHFLDGLTNEQAREFLCRNVQHLLEPDTLATELPKSLEICKYYNVATGCTRDFCPYIHVCRFYAEEGNCKFGSQCIRKHDINNVHSRILLHRYHMDHLSDPQVITYLKIKSESRDQQQLQQANANGQNLKNEKLQCSQSPTKLQTYFPNHFSLPNSSTNGFLSEVHNFMNENSRKLSQPSTTLPIVSVMESSIHTRKLSLPNQPVTKSCLRNGPSTPDSSHLIGMKSSSIPHHDMLVSHVDTENRVFSDDIHRSNSFSRQMPPALSYANPFSSSNLEQHNTLNGDSIEATFVKTSSSLMSTPSLSYSSEKVSHSFNDRLLPYMNENGSRFSTALRESNNNDNGKFSLGLNNLSSPPTTTSHFYCNGKTSESNLNELLGHNFFKSKSYENFSKDHIREKVPVSLNGVVSSKSQHLFNDTFSSSLHNEMRYRGTSPRSSFFRGSSSDIVSPTGSSSSMSGFNGFTNGFTDHSMLFGSSDWTEKRKCMDEELNYICYRTRSLPNFNAHECVSDGIDKQTNLFNSKNLSKNECDCRKSEVCFYNLVGKCQASSCERLHTTDTFQWQISSLPTELPPQNSYVNYNKNENDFSLITREWVNLDKNENTKLELAFSSCEIEQTDIDFFGDTLTIYLEEMIGVGTSKSDMGSTNQIISRSCDLSSWLLQPNDDSISRSGSQENVVYNIRRLSTKPAIMKDVDPRFSTHWLWYWQDSFGMWRQYPRSKNDVIEANVCLNEDIERKYNEGCSQYIFDDFQMHFDFKNMTQTNTLSGKQKKIRRRALFMPFEQRCASENTEAEIRYSGVSFPYYWPSFSSDNKEVNTYERIALDESTDIYQFVYNQFKEAMGQTNYELVSLESIQNVHLWRCFSNLKNDLLDAKLELVEKFVFKMVSHERLSEICQQGYPVCLCGALPEESIFFRKAEHALRRYEGEKQPCHMLCFRMCVSVDARDHPEGFNEKLECKHVNQIYPEFLIVFNRF